MNYNKPEIKIIKKRFKQPIIHKVLFKLFKRETLKKFPIWFLNIVGLHYILYTIEAPTVKIFYNQEFVNNLILKSGDKYGK